MCGICGYIGIDSDQLVKQMTAKLEHRGPDDYGYFSEGGVHLGHRRLSIIDLASGHQPMTSPDGALTIVYNGEIYNYKELRAELQTLGHQFHTTSDTEVLIRLYQEEGPRALQKLNGMFALAIYDHQKQELFLARDRIGIKPLYYLLLPGRMLFASEIKSLLVYQDWTPTIRPQAIHDYLALRYIPGSKGMFAEVNRLPAGHYLIYRNGRTETHRYWQPPYYEGPYNRSDADYLEEFAELMKASVRRRLISDVPFGAYLSGGLDSSVIVALMSDMVSDPVKTFSVGFDYEHDELKQAAFTAQYLGSDHHEVACRAEDISLLPEIVYHTDEPMGDAITIPMYMLSKAAKREVSVILTGEGGDEVFGGYLFHKVMWAGDLYRRLVPHIMRDHIVKPILAKSPAAALNLAFQYPAYLGERGKLKALDYLDLLEPDQIDAAYRHLISLFDARDTGSLYSPDFQTDLDAAYALNGNKASYNIMTSGPYLNRLIHLQFDHWLPDNMLYRQDKTGMANAIEGRVPYLDHELVEFSLRLPPHLKLHRLAGKYILRQFGRQLLPPQVLKRKKMPFYVPIENYFQQPSFQEMMDELLSEASIRQRGIFQPQSVSRLRNLMKQQEFIPVKQVFSLMVLELWFRIFVDRSWSI